MLSLIVVLAVSAAPDLPRRLYDQTHGGRWLDAAEAWATERGELSVEEGAPEWITRAALAVTLQLEHPELAKELRPPWDPDPQDYLPKWDVLLPKLYDVSTLDAHARWEIALGARMSVEFADHRFQSCAVLVGLLAGAAGRQLATACGPLPEKPSPGDRRAEAILSRFRLQPRAEPLLPFPTGDTPLTASRLEWSGARGKKVDLKKLKLPSGFHAVRAEEAGPRTVVLAAASKLENPDAPVLEYWLLLGRPGEWTEYFLGVDAFRPSAAMLDSAVPLLAGDDIVRIEFTDEGLLWSGFKNYRIDVKRNYLLSARLAELTRDTDHDGLTDALERRLLLDPTLFDTDWDLIGDADDPAPRSHERAEVPQSLLGLALARTRALVHKRMNGTAKSSLRAPVLFAANGAPPRLEGLQLVPMSLDEFKAARVTDRDQTGDEVVMVLDESGQHAFIEWRTNWSRSGFRVDRAADGGVSVDEISGWVQ